MTNPWYVKPTNVANHYTILADGDWLAAIQFNGKFTMTRQDEYMRLIAAAPDLLAALRNAVRIVDFYMKSLGVEPADIQKSLAPLRAAIARAEGREP